MDTLPKASLKKKRSRFFETYNTKLLKQVSDTNGITTNTKQQLNSAICLISKILSSKIIFLTEVAKKKTMSEKEVKNALKIVFTGELAKNAIIAGQKAVDKTENNGLGNTKGSSRQEKAGIIFPPAILEKFLRNFGYSKFMLTSQSPVYLAAAIEYLTAEILENASSYAKDNKRVRISIRDLEMGVRNDKELNDFFIKNNITFLGGGVLPFIHSSLLAKKNRMKRVNIKKFNGVSSNTDSEQLIDLIGKKKHRFRPGTVSIREIRRFQKMSNCLTFAKFPFEKLVRQVVAEHNTNENTMKISKDVFIVLQYFIEQQIVSILHNANFAAIHAGRVKLIPVDIDFICAIKDGGRNPYQINSNNYSGETLQIDDILDEDVDVKQDDEEDEEDEEDKEDEEDEEDDEDDEEDEEDE